MKQKGALKMKKAVKWFVVTAVVVLSSVIGCMSAFAAGELYFDFRNNTAGGDWRLNDVAAFQGDMLEVTTPSDKFAEHRLQKTAYLNGDVVIEFDFMAQSSAMNFYVQNPLGGSVFRLQLVKGTTTLQMQHSKADGTGNENTVVYKKFEKGKWYHVKAVINYKTGTEKATQASLYLYDANGNLLGSAENKLYMDAVKNANPEDLRIFMMNIPSTVAADGSAYFDNIAVYRDTDESVAEINALALNPNDGKPVTENVTLPTAKYGNASVTWTSDTPSVLADDGTLVKALAKDTVVNMTALIQCGNATKSVQFPLTVVGNPIEPEAPEVYWWDFKDNLLPEGFHTNNSAKAGVKNQRLEFSAGSETDNRMTVDLTEVKYGYGAVSGQFFMEFDFVTTATVAEICCIQASPNTGSLVRLEQTDAENGRITTGGMGGTENTNTSFALTQGKNYHVKLYMDYTAERCSFWLDEAASVENHAFMDAESPGALKEIALRNAETEGDGVLALDNIIIYRTDAASAVTATKYICQMDTENTIFAPYALPQKGYNGAEITWTSSVPNLIDNNGNLTTESFRAEETVLTAVISKEDTAVTETFHVRVAKAPLVEISDYRLNTASGTQMDCRVRNTTADRIESVLAVLAVYKNNKLIACSSERVNLPGGGSGELSLSVPQNGDSAELYLWDINMAPLCPKYQ